MSPSKSPSQTAKFPSSAATDRILSITQHLQETESTRSIGSREGKMSETSYKFQGWIGLDKEAGDGNMVWQEYEPKTWTEDDVDIKVTHCGVCGSDIHTLRSGWGPNSTIYPCCVGHEVVGTAVKVGKNVKHISLGERCGVGAQSGSCLRADCYECMNDLEQCCPQMVGTYNGKYADGSRSYGGYSDYVRAPGHFVVKIPNELSLAEAAPMLCGGVTMWNPLRKNGAGPGKSVGIVGIGGLGHFGLLWAKALGCDRVVAISRNSSKKADVLKMGADDLIATEEDKNWFKNHRSTLDLIVSTISGPNVPLASYFRLLRTNGQFIQVGAPEDKFPPLSAFDFISKNVKLGGSLIGSPRDITEMLEFAAKNNIHPWIEEVPLKDANKAIVDLGLGKPRYRYVLKNEAHAKELGL